MDAVLGKLLAGRETVGLYHIVKRGQDVLLSVGALMLLWPVFLLIGLLIVADSPGESPIFIQTRVGKDGAPFRLYKFRSMRPGAEQERKALLLQNEMDGPVFKIRHDPRVTRFGRFLRRSGLDELPQLWNVLRGDMSLVGPRPSLPEEVALFTAFERRRLEIKPGLTCYWQIQPRRNSLSFARWMELDLAYLKEQSFLTDWKIIFATLRAIARMDGQ